MKAVQSGMLLTLSALFLCAAHLPAQNPVPAARTEVVRVDAVVTDAQGRPVRGLTAADFEVREDGQAQRIVQFVAPLGAVAHGTAYPIAPAPAPVSPNDGASAATQRATPSPVEGAGRTEAPSDDRVPPRRHVVIVIDDQHISAGNLESAKQALMALTDGLVAQGDAIAVVATSTPGDVQQPTRDRARLRQALQRLQVRQAFVAAQRGSDMTPVQAEMILAGDRSALTLTARKLVTDPGGVYDVTSPQVAVGAPSGGLGSGTAGSGSSTDAREAIAAREAQRQARAVLAEALRFSAGSLSVLDGVVRSLAPVGGRKLVLLVSDGFQLGRGTSEERLRDLQRLADSATRIGTPVHVLETRGVLTGGEEAAAAGRDSQPGLQFRVDRQADQILHGALETVAAQTGGIAVRGTSDLGAALRRALEDPEPYRMAYEPTNTRRDGRFRKIEVRVRGLTVRARKGYLAPDDRAAATAPGTGALTASSSRPTNFDAAAARAALREPLPVGSLPVRLSAQPVSLPPVGSQLMIRAHVGLGELLFRDEAGRKKATLEIVGGLFDRGGQLVGEPFGRHAALDLPPEAAARAAREGLSYQAAVPAPPGLFEVRLMVRERAVRQSGGAAQAVEVPDTSRDALSMSGVFLFASAAGSDALRDVQAEQKFARGDTLTFQFYVNGARVNAQGQRDVVLQAQIWSRDKAVAASRAAPAALAEKDGVPLPESQGLTLAGLDAGAYELRVVVVDRMRDATVFRRLDFTIE